MRRCTREGIRWPHVLDLPDDPLEQREGAHARRRHELGLTINQGFANGPLVTPSLREWLYPWVEWGHAPTVLSQWVIYDHPRDVDAAFLVRRWEIGRGAVVPREAVGARSLVHARALLPSGLVRIGRSPGDDPVIREVWT